MTEDQRQRLVLELGAELRAELAEAVIVVDGGGAYCRVGERLCEVSCFWYGDVAGLFLGMSANNAHLGAVDPGLEREPRRGAAYLIVLYDGGRRIADGRAHAIADVIRCARAWVVDRRPLEALYEPFPFVDCDRRALAHAAALIEAGLRPAPPVRVIIECEIGYELWVYGDRRSCRVAVAVADGACACAFLVVQSQAARVVVSEAELAGAVSAWTQERVGLEELRRRYPGLVIEPHGELLDGGEVARWHWLNVLDRARGPGPTLAPFLPLIERILERFAISSFFSFTSLERLCFSSSSNYPFVTAGLPILSPAGDARYIVESRGGEYHEADVERALELIEAALAAAPHRPFHGSEPDLVKLQVDDELARQGKSLRVDLLQSRQWYSALLQLDRRACELSSNWNWHARFYEEPRGQLDHASFSDLATVVRAACRWLEGMASLEEICSEAMD